MFGDNLSIISDTTIAATQILGCDMRDKFRNNIGFALPAAIIAFFIYIYVGAGTNEVAHTATPVNLSSAVLVIPYLAVIVLAFLGWMCFCIDYWYCTKRYFWFYLPRFQLSGFW